MTKMSNCALGIMGALHAPTDMKQQMELPLKSAHFYNYAVIRQLESRPIEGDCATTLASPLKKKIRGLHECTFQHFRHLVSDRDTLRIELDFLRPERDSLRADYDAVSEDYPCRSSERERERETLLVDVENAPSGFVPTMERDSLLE